MMRPSNRGVVPSGGTCRYVDPDAGFVVSHPMWDWCKVRAKDERIKRGLPIPYDWDSFFERGFCKGTPQGCYEVPDMPIETGPSWTKLAVQFGASLMNWIRAGAPVVSWELFKERHLKCTGDETHSRCPAFTKFQSLGISKCGKCGCSTGVKLWLATEKCPLQKW